MKLTPVEHDPRVNTSGVTQQCKHCSTPVHPQEVHCCVALCQEHHGIGARVTCAICTAPSEPKDLTDDELEAFEWHGCSSGTSTPPIVRDAILRACAELRRRRRESR